MKAVIVPTNNKSLLSTENNNLTPPIISNLKSRVSDQINYLSNAGVDELLIIQGFGNEEFADFFINSTEIEIKIKIIPNPFQFQSADTLIALWMAISEINDDVFILNWESLLKEEILERFIKYEDGTSCFLVNKKRNGDRKDKAFNDQDQDIVEIGNKKDLKHLISSDSIDLCTFRQSGVALIKESIEDEIRTDDANKKEFVSVIYRFIRKEHMVCKVKSLDIGDIYKIYTDSPKNTYKVAANSSDQIGKNHGQGYLRVINTSSE